MSSDHDNSAELPKPRIDWSAIRRRLDSAAAAAERGDVRSAEEQKRILKARAQSLARVPQEAGGTDNQLGILEFVLAHEHYAIASSFVREVCPLRELTPLPGTPLFARGIINVRGQIVSIVDLKKFFDLPDKGLTDLNKVIIIGNAHLEFGLLVDAIVTVQTIALTEIQAPPPTLTGIRQEYLQGVTARRLAILNAEKLLSDPNIIVRESAKA